MGGGSISYRNRFPLPDNWTVDEFVCCVIPLPNDPQYIGMFRGLIDTLTWQRSFALHPTEQAAFLVSKTWQNCFASRELKFVDCEDIDMTFDMRQKPGVPWVTEVSVDGGVTWHIAIEQPHWPTAVVGPSVSGRAQAADAAGAIMRLFYQYIMGQIETGRVAGQTDAQIANEITGQFNQYGAGAAFTNAVANASAVWRAKSSGERTDYQTDCGVMDEFLPWREFINSNPYTWLNNAASWIYSTLNTLSDDLMTTLNNAAAALGGDAVWNWTANQGGAGGGAGFGATCTYTHDWDFAIAPGDWYSYGIQQALYVPGTGWTQDLPFDTGLNWELNIAIRLDFPDGANLVTTAYDYAVSLDPGGAGNDIIWWNESVAVSNAAANGSGTITFTYAPGQDRDNVEYQKAISSEPTEPALTGSGVITGAHISGNGADPFYRLP